MYIYHILRTSLQSQRLCGGCTWETVLQNSVSMGSSLSPRQLASAIPRTLTQSYHCKQSTLQLCFLCRPFESMDACVLFADSIERIVISQPLQQIAPEKTHRNEPDRQNAYGIQIFSQDLVQACRHHPARMQVVRFTDQVRLLLCARKLLRVTSTPCKEHRKRSLTEIEIGKSIFTGCIRCM